MIRTFSIALTILISAGCASAPARKATLMSYEVQPKQSVVVLDKYTVTHEGYGHRITSSGGGSFFSFLVTENSKPDQHQSLRITLPVDTGQTYEWRDLQLTVLSCEDQGPPHSENAKVAFSAKTLETIASGAKHRMKTGDAAVFENGPTLKLTHFGHDDDDEGGHTIANFIVSAENRTQNLMIFSSTAGPMIETWRDWTIQIHKWNEQGPPHTAAQSVDVSVVKNRPASK